MINIYKRRKRRGVSMAEMPAAMYLIFFGMLLPLIGLATIGYRMSLIYFAVRDSCWKAAKSSTFTLAQSNAATAWAADTAAWHGISGTEQVYIVTQPIAGGPESVTQTKFPTTNKPNVQTNMYFIRMIATCQIAPFFYSANYNGLGHVPGLNAPFPVTIKYQYYVESASGLTQ